MLLEPKKVGDMWECPAIDHGVTIFPDGRIRPCCQTSAEYSKPLSEITNPARFQDLKSFNNPDACKSCWSKEQQGLDSYRRMYQTTVTNAPGIQFLDVRHSNQCNLKCRYCNPHFSNQWAKELSYPITLQQSKFDDYSDHLLTKDLVEIYWCGGEPLINSDHYNMLETLISNGLSKNIKLRYNTNFTVIQYKDKNVFDLWQQFKSVSLSISVDAVGEISNYIRSGSDWNSISANIDLALEKIEKNPKISISLSPVVSLLSIWTLPELYKYAEHKKISVKPILLHGPDYLSLMAIHTKLKPLAISTLNSIRKQLGKNYDQFMSRLTQDDNEYLFNQAVRHILLLDKLRQEKLFELLPFQQLAIELTLKNYEYE
jgi:sulfatase maturation enzyme AslB (radical SAM superfamily)